MVGGPRDKQAVLVGLILLVGLSYGGTLSSEFVYDDVVHIAHNESLRRLDSIPRFFVSTWYYGTEEQIGVARPTAEPTDPWTKRYRPLVSVSYVLNAVVGGLNPAGFHLVNVLVHGGVSWLLYCAALQLGLSAGAAILAAILFAVHPLHTEAVAWVVGRPELFMAASVLGGLWFVMKGYRRWALLAFVCGLLSKEQAVMLPVIVLLHDLLLGKPMTRGREARTVLSIVWARYRWYIVILAAYVSLRFAMFGRTPSDVYQLLQNPLDHLHGGAWALSALKMAGRYLWLTLWPAALSVDYSYNAIPMATSFWDLGVIWALCAWAGLLWLAAWSFKRDPRIAFAIGLTVVTFAPVSNVFISAGYPLAERWFYLPLAGLCLLVGLGYERVAFGVQRSAFTVLGRGILVVLCVALTLRTIARVSDWKSNETLFRSTVQVVPQNAKAHALLGDALRNHGHPGSLEEALAEYRTALNIYPDYTDVSAHFATSYGHALLDLGHSSEALIAFEKAVTANPRWSRTYYNLGLIYAQLGQYDKAERAWSQAVALSPDDPQIHSSLSRLAIERGRYEEGLAEADRALAKAPGLIMAAYNRALALQGLGRLAEAAATYERVLLSPSVPEEIKQDVTRKLQSLPSRPRSS